MADIFQIEPPRWLQSLTASNDKGLLGGILGELAGGALIAADKAGDPNSKENWFQALPKSVAEAHLSVLDPMWRIKVQQGQLNIAHTGLQLQEMQQQIGMNATKIRLTAEDTAEIPKWLQEHPTVESRMEAQWPAARTPEWNRNLDQLRLRDSQSSQEKIKIQGTKAFTDRVAKLPEDLAAPLIQYFGKVPPPEAFAQLDTAERIVAAKREQAELLAEQSRLKGETTLETRITGKDVTKIYKPSDTSTAKAKDRVGTEMTTASGIHVLWVGPNQLRVTEKSGAQSDLTPGQLLQYASKFQYSADPKQRGIVSQIKEFIGEKAQEQISRMGTKAPAATNAPVAAPGAPTKPVAVVGQGTQSDPAKPTTQQQFDTLPSGAYFINPKDGKIMRKK